MAAPVTAEQMKKLDEYTINEIGIPSMVLMERAALASVEEFYIGGTRPGKWKFDIKKVLCVCGSGNNGGDGFAVARLLAMKGVDTDILFIGKKANLSNESFQQFKIAEKLKLNIFENDVDIIRKNGYTALIDGIFGIGLSREVTGLYKNVIDEMNELKESKGVRILSLDIPSGLSADTGKATGVAAAVVKADKTVTFAFNKVGLTQKCALEFTGEIIVKDIGIYRTS